MLEDALDQRRPWSLMSRGFCSKNRYQYSGKRFQGLIRGHGSVGLLFASSTAGPTALGLF
jgi:hypothetical protein